MYYADDCARPYQKILKRELTKDEEASFSNKAQIILNKIAEECAPPTIK